MAGLYFLVSRLFMATLPGKYMTVCVLFTGSAGRGVAEPGRSDPGRSANPEDPMSQLAVEMLALFGQMERTFAIERPAMRVPLLLLRVKGSAGPASLIQQISPRPCAFAARRISPSPKSVHRRASPAQPLPSPAAPATGDTDPLGFPDLRWLRSLFCGFCRSVGAPISLSIESWSGSLGFPNASRAR